MNSFNKQQIFNPTGSDEAVDRKIVGGNSTGIANLNNIKYSWAEKLYRIMVANFWLPNNTSLVNDKNRMSQLTEDEIRSTKYTLSFLIALDSMQSNVLPRMLPYITAPEVASLYRVQAFQEEVHSQSYQYILNELFSPSEREEIYNMWRDVPILLERNQYIASLYNTFLDNPNEETFKYAIAADFTLEGLYFYNGFNFFYNMQSQHKLTDVAKIIKQIENDEVTHVSFMIRQVKDLFDLNNPSDVEILRSTLITGALHEIAWSKFAYKNILGITEQSSEEYNKWLANQRARVIGLDPVFEGNYKNVYAHLDDKKKANFFETKVPEYSQPEAVGGWDDF